jgi:molybdopterin converting factor small subunit
MNINNPEDDKKMEDLKKEFTQLFQEWDKKLEDVNLEEINKYMSIVNEFMEDDGWVPERDGRTMEDIEKDYKKEMGDEDCDEGLYKDN